MWINVAIIVTFIPSLTKGHSYLIDRDMIAKNDGFKLNFRSGSGVVRGQVFRSLGCWKDRWIRSIQLLEKRHELLMDGNYKLREDPLRKCAIAALDNHMKLFAIENGGQCLGDTKITSAYMKYGGIDQCKDDGYGGPWSMQVYGFTGHRSRRRHDGYTAWSKWTKCSKKCGNGTRKRFRICSHSSPVHGGRDCRRLGPGMQTQSCETECLGTENDEFENSSQSDRINSKVKAKKKSHPSSRVSKASDDNGDYLEDDENDEDEDEDYSNDKASDSTGLLNKFKDKPKKSDNIVHLSENVANYSDNEVNKSENVTMHSEDSNSNSEYRASDSDDDNHSHLGEWARNSTDVDISRKAFEKVSVNDENKGEKVAEVSQGTMDIPPGNVGKESEQINGLPNKSKMKNDARLDLTQPNGVEQNTKSSNQNRSSNGQPTKEQMKAAKDLLRSKWLSLAKSGRPKPTENTVEGQGQHMEGEVNNETVDKEKRLKHVVGSQLTSVKMEKPSEDQALNDGKEDGEGRHMEASQENEGEMEAKEKDKAVDDGNLVGHVEKSDYELMNGEKNYGMKENTKEDGSKLVEDEEKMEDLEMNEDKTNENVNQATLDAGSKLIKNEKNLKNQDKNANKTKETTIDQDNITGHEKNAENQQMNEKEKANQAEQDKNQAIENGDAKNDQEMVGNNRQEKAGEKFVDAAEMEEDLEPVKNRKVAFQRIVEGKADGMSMDTGDGHKMITQRGAKRVKEECVCPLLVCNHLANTGMIIDNTYVTDINDLNEMKGFAKGLAIGFKTKEEDVQMGIIANGLRSQILGNHRRSKSENQARPINSRYERQPVRPLYKIEARNNGDSNKAYKRSQTSSNKPRPQNGLRSTTQGSKRAEAYLLIKQKKPIPPVLNDVLFVLVSGAKGDLEVHAPMKKMKAAGTKIVAIAVGKDAKMGKWADDADQKIIVPPGAGNAIVNVLVKAICKPDLMGKPTPNVKPCPCLLEPSKKTSPASKPSPLQEMTREEYEMGLFHASGQLTGNTSSNMVSQSTPHVTPDTFKATKPTFLQSSGTIPTENQQTNGNLPEPQSSDTFRETKPSSSVKTTTSKTANQPEGEQSEIKQTPTNKFISMKHDKFKPLSKTLAVLGESLNNAHANGKLKKGGQALENDIHNLLNTIGKLKFQVDNLKNDQLEIEDSRDDNQLGDASETASQSEETSESSSQSSPNIASAGQSMQTSQNVSQSVSNTNSVDALDSQARLGNETRSKSNNANHLPLKLRIIGKHGDSKQNAMVLHLKLKDPPRAMKNNPQATKPTVQKLGKGTNANIEPTSSMAQTIKGAHLSIPQKSGLPAQISSNEFVQKPNNLHNAEIPQSRVESLDNKREHDKNPIISSATAQNIKAQQPRKNYLPIQAKQSGLEAQTTSSNVTVNQSPNTASATMGKVAQKISDSLIQTRQNSQNIANTKPTTLVAIEKLHPETQHTISEPVVSSSSNGATPSSPLSGERVLQQTAISQTGKEPPLVLTKGGSTAVAKLNANSKLQDAKVNIQSTSIPLQGTETTNEKASTTLPKSNRVPQDGIATDNIKTTQQNMPIAQNANPTPPRTTTSNIAATGNTKPLQRVVSTIPNANSLPLKRISQMAPVIQNGIVTSDTKAAGERKITTQKVPLFAPKTTNQIAAQLPSAAVNQISPGVNRISFTGRTNAPPQKITAAQIGTAANTEVANRAAPQRITKQVPIIPAQTPPKSIDFTALESNLAQNRRAEETALKSFVPACDINLAFALDGSASVEGTKMGNFLKMINFVKDVIHEFVVLSQAVHVGTIVYSTNTQVILNFGTKGTEKAIDQILDNIQYPGQGSLTGKAIKECWNQILSSAPRGRKNKLVLLTDGPANDDVKAPSKWVKDNGVEVFVIGLGKGCDEAQLKDIASTPSDQHILLKDFDDLRTSVQEIRNKICGFNAEQVLQIMGSERLEDSIEEINPIQRSFPQCILDVVFLLDGSRQVETNDAGNFEREKQFVKMAVKYLPLSRDDVHVGVGLLGDTNVMVFPMNEHYTRKSIDYELDHIRYPASSNIRPEEVKYARQIMLLKGVRDVAPRVFVLVTDVSSLDSYRQAVDELRKDGSDVATFGVSSEEWKQEVKVRSSVQGMIDQVVTLDTANQNEAAKNFAINMCKLSTSKRNEIPRTQWTASDKLLNRN